MRHLKIRTTDQRDADQERSQERYDRIYSEVEAEHRADWEAEFDCEIGYSFKPDGCAIHRETQRRVELEQRHDAEESAG